jgi:ribosome-binding factor A
MPYDNRRPDRVAEAIREEVAGFLADGVKDPRVRGLVTVTGVDLTRDLRHARVFVSVLGSDAERDETLAALGSIAAHLRGRVGRALRLRVAPEIAFERDESVARAARIETLLEQIRRQEQPADAPEGATVEEGGDEAGSDDPSGQPSDAPGAPDAPVRPAGA